MLEINLKSNFIAILLKLTVISFASAQQTNLLPVWTEGNLDVLVMKTGRGDAIFAIMPDGTTLLTDPGELNLADPRTESRRNTPAYPNASRFADEWISAYILQINPNPDPSYVDYAFLTHFHDDHYGAVHEGTRRSAYADYLLTGLTGVGDRIRFGKIVDRGYPHYNFPFDLKKQLADKRNPLEYNTLMNYLDFLAYKQREYGMEVEQFAVGSDSQFVMKRKAGQYARFHVRNIHGNGLVWKKATGRVDYAFPDTALFTPPENNLSCGILISYGDFRLFLGGDIQGVPSVGQSDYYNLERVVAPSIGKVDVAVANHHAARDALNPDFVSTLSPRVWLQTVWSSDQPSHETLIRMSSTHLYPGERDIFSTGMLESNRLVIGELIDRAYASTDGHIWLQVQPNGTYHLHTLKTDGGKLVRKDTFGPYQSSEK